MQCRWRERTTGMKKNEKKEGQRCKLVRFTRKAYGFLRFARAYGRTMQSLRIFMIFTDSNLQSFHALYSNCCQFAVTPAMLREHESKWSVSEQVVFCLFIVYGCVTAGSYTKIVFCNGVDNFREFVRISLQIVRIFCHDLTYRSCPLRRGVRKVRAI